MVQNKTLQELADAEVKHALEGDCIAARRIIEQATVGIRDIDAGLQIDNERMIYLRFISYALVQILDGIPPEIALCIKTGDAGAPTKDTTERDFLLFLQVGQKLDEQRKSGADKPINEAIAWVSRNTQKYSRATIKKAWQSMGGQKAWVAQKHL